MIIRAIAFGILCVAISACVTGPRGGIQSDLVRLGLSKDRASCLAKEMDDRLDRDDMRDVSDFLSGLRKSESAGNILDTFLTIDNPRATAAFARAGISCAF